MPDLRIGKASIPVEGIRELKAGVDINKDDAVKAQLMKDGLDEIVFQKGDKVFIAYKTNLELSRLQLNLESFDENSAYDAGQLSLDGEAVKVLFVDDESKESFWAAPYKGLGRSIVNMINEPAGKSAMVSFAGGVATGIVGKVVPGAAERVPGDIIIPSTMSVGMKSVIIGTLIGSTAAGLKAGAEDPEWAHPGIAVLNAACWAGGVGAGVGGVELAKIAGRNPVATAVTVGTAAAVIGTGLVLDALSDNSKTVTYKVINKIAN
jgi:hypothetical protein